MHLSGLDTFVVCLYLLLSISIGLYVSRNSTLEDFFVNSRRTNLFLLVCTALSTSAGASSVLGVASSAYSSGISFGLSFMIASFSGWLLAAYMAPRIKEWGDESKSFTIGQFLGQRFSARTQLSASFVTASGYFVFTAVQYVAFAKLLESLFTINYLTALIVSAIFTLSYTVAAGIKGDFYTDAIQLLFMIPIFALTIGFGLLRVNFEALHNIPERMLSPFEYAGPTFFFASIFLSFPLITVYMEIWQRILAAENSTTARNACYISGFLKVLIIFLSIAIGFLSYLLVPGVNNDAAIYSLMRLLLPSGLLGLGYASIIALLMSTIDSMVLVGSATITNDFLYRDRKCINESEALWSGRLIAMIFGISGLFAAFFVPDIVRLSVSGAQMLLVLAPAIIGGLVWQHVREEAAFWSITSGFCVTLMCLPFIPDLAFLPGTAVCLLVFFIIQGVSLFEDSERFPSHP